MLMADDMTETLPLTGQQTAVLKAISPTDYLSYAASSTRDR
jgi:hypothetical protein